jgi:hypothetical protein
MRRKERKSLVLGVDMLLITAPAIVCECEPMSLNCGLGGKMQGDERFAELLHKAELQFQQTSLIISNR